MYIGYQPKKVQEPELEPAEDITLVRVDFDEFLDMVDTGTIRWSFDFKHEFVRMKYSAKHKQAFIEEFLSH